MRRWLVLGILTACSAGAEAQTPPDYGFEWGTIGSPGNRHTIPAEVPWDTNRQVGAVNYEFRIMRSKLDVASYAEFVRAYAPHWTGSPIAMALTGPFVQAVSLPGGGWDYRAVPGEEHYAARMDWTMAARYCNWLHNGKATNSAAFETGVYDTTTFHGEPGGWTSNLQPLPGAQFWIPNLHEWTKAAHYDPNRYGPGQGGYWQYPDGSDEPLTMGLPGQGETIGDLPWQLGFDELSGSWDLNQYPHVQSPWGLRDISGTVPDYTMSLANPNLNALWTGGSMAGHIGWEYEDRIDHDWVGAFYGDTSGALRIASSVPTPPALLSIIVIAMHIARSRRRCA